MKSFNSLLTLLSLTGVTKLLNTLLIIPYSVARVYAPTRIKVVIRISGS